MSVYIELGNVENFVCGFCKSHNISNGCDECKILDEVRKIPHADVVGVKRGIWINDYDADADVFFRHGWRCSCCGKRNTYGPSEKCPLCGAEMTRR